METEHPVFHYWTQRINDSSLEPAVKHPMDLRIVSEHEAPLQARLLKQEVRIFEGATYLSANEPRLAYAGNFGQALIDDVADESTYHLIIGQKLYRKGEPCWTFNAGNLELSVNAFGPSWEETDWDRVIEKLDLQGGIAYTEFNPIQFTSDFHARRSAR